MNRSDLGVKMLMLGLCRSVTLSDLERTLSKFMKKLSNRSAKSLAYTSTPEVAKPAKKCTNNTNLKLFFKMYWVSSLNKNSLANPNKTCNNSKSIWRATLTSTRWANSNKSNHFRAKLDFRFPSKPWSTNNNCAVLKRTNYMKSNFKSYKKCRMKFWR